MCLLGLDKSACLLCLTMLSTHFTAMENIREIARSRSGDEG
jgi:hypothetical protein